MHCDVNEITIGAIDAKKPLASSVHKVCGRLRNINSFREHDGVI